MKLPAGGRPPERMSTKPVLSDKGTISTDCAETATAAHRTSKGMNETHLQFLASPAWADLLQTELLPWIEAAGDLGDDVLEVGPGPGLTTDILRQRVPQVTAVEIDPSLGEQLRD